MCGHCTGDNTAVSVMTYSTVEGKLYCLLQTMLFTAVHIHTDTYLCTMELPDKDEHGVWYIQGKTVLRAHTRL